jgi:hypothetical protein
MKIKHCLTLLNLDHSVIEFLIKNKPQGELACSRDLVPQKALPIFNCVKDIYLCDKIKYDDKPICLYIFTNAQFNKLAIFDQTNSFLIKNLWKFQTKITNDSSISINSKIMQLEISGYMFDLNESLLNPLVFESVEKILMSLSIGSIQTNLFKSFSNLSHISICPANMTNFFHIVGTEWTLSFDNIR